MLEWRHTAVLSDTTQTLCIYYKEFNKQHMVKGVGVQWSFQVTMKKHISTLVYS